MGYLKGKNALVLCGKHPEWRSRIGKDRMFWARGYYVSTVGLNEAMMRNSTGTLARTKGVETR